jgi:hypothetical protein
MSEGAVVPSESVIRSRTQRVGVSVVKCSTVGGLVAGALGGAGLFDTLATVGAIPHGTAELALIAAGGLVAGGAGGRVLGTVINRRIDAAVADFETSPLGQVIDRYVTPAAPAETEAGPAQARRATLSERLRETRARRATEKAAPAAEGVAGD